jgi:lipopolysaccharide/colanic/teichoic acid biosynthesis glycosyltransferase
MATAVLVVLFPLFISIYLIQFFFVDHPFFIQDRPGRNGTIFKMLKFRTFKIDDDVSSVTWFGKFLRASSLDELPQLLNILRGEMSFVGPRPLLVEYLPLYSDNQRKRHNVKPGITGLAQVKGRNSISWNESLKLDVEYADNLSFTLDLKILLMTITHLISSLTAPHGFTAQRERFNGKN